MPRLLRLSRRDRLPIFDRLAADLLIRPFEEVRLMGRHHDDNGDHIADWAPDQETDEQVLEQLHVLDEDEHADCAVEPCHIGDPT